MSLTTSEIKKLIKESIDSALNDYFATNGKYIIEGIIRESLTINNVNQSQKPSMNPLQEAQMVIGNSNNTTKSNQPSGNPYGGAYGDILKQTASRGINASDLVDHSIGI